MREQKVGNSPLATRITMNNGKRKFIGTVSNKLQLVITLPSQQIVNEKLQKLFNKYHKQVLIYLISPKEIAQNKNVMHSTDFLKLSKKLGLFVDNQECGKSVFIIDGNRKIVYTEISRTLHGTFNIDLLDKTLQKILMQKSEPREEPKTYYQDITPWYLEHI